MEEITHMKKSKILIPAIAVLALSAGAATTGTLAWFTASRSASFVMNNVAVVNTSGALTATVVADTANGSTSTVADQPTQLNFSLLKDASYDIYQDKIYQPVFSENSEVSEYNQLTTNSKVATVSAGNVYATAQFSITFSMTVNTSDSAYDLIFDLRDDGSYLEGSDAILSGFRLGVYDSTKKIGVGGNEQTTPELVWAPKYNATANSDHVNELQYVDSENLPAEDYPAYSSSVAVIGNDASYFNDNSGATTVEAKPQYVGKFEYNNGSSSSLNLNFVAWFEGLDAETTSDVLTNVISSYYNLHLKFYAVKVAAE
jgi:hypothetical protein